MGMHQPLLQRGFALLDVASPRTALNRSCMQSGELGETTARKRFACNPRAFHQDLGNLPTAKKSPAFSLYVNSP